VEEEVAEADMAVDDIVEVVEEEGEAVVLVVEEGVEDVPDCNL
jgi:hypothetical protein